jgi:hypothetical protein
MLEPCIEFFCNFERAMEAQVSRARVIKLFIFLASVVMGSLLERILGNGKAF